MAAKKTLRPISKLSGVDIFKLPPGFYAANTLLNDFDVFGEAGKCQNDCVFCVEPKFGSMPIKTTRGKKHGQLLIGSRECTTIPGIADIIALLGEKYKKISIGSNGQKFSDIGFADKILAAGVRNISISLHAPSRAVHDSLSKRRGAFEKTLSGIKNIIFLKNKKKYSVNVAVNFVVTKKNIRYIRKFVGFAGSLGVRDVNFLAMIPMGSAKNIYRKMMPRYQDIAEAVFKIKKTDQSSPILKKMRIFLVHVPYCTLPEQDIKNDFRVLISPRTGQFDEINGNDLKKICRKCRFYAYCEGMPKDYATLYNKETKGAIKRFVA
jgi:MoaA/NifB/PqqE/SkfB family radical SAM enzyme